MKWRAHFENASGQTWTMVFDGYDDRYTAEKQASNSNLALSIAHDYGAWLSRIEKEERQ